MRKLRALDLFCCGDGRAVVLTWARTETKEKNDD